MKMREAHPPGVFCKNVILKRLDGTWRKNLILWELHRQIVATFQTQDNTEVQVD